jgi:hypothetical protein
LNKLLNNCPPGRQFAPLTPQQIDHLRAILAFTPGLQLKFLTPKQIDYALFTTQMERAGWTIEDLVAITNLVTPN